MSNDRPPRPPLPPLKPAGYDDIPIDARPSERDPSETAATQPAMRAVRVPLGTESPPAWAQYLIAGFDNLNAKADEMGGQLVQLFDDKKTSNQRMTRLEERFDRFEERYEDASKRHSDGLKKGSETDLKHESEFGKVHERLDTLEQKTDAQTAILERLDKIAESPVVKRTAYALAMALLAWLAAKGH